MSSPSIYNLNSVRVRYHGRCLNSWPACWTVLEFEKVSVSGNALLAGDLFLWYRLQGQSRKGLLFPCGNTLIDQSQVPHVRVPLPEVRGESKGEAPTKETNGGKVIPETPQVKVQPGKPDFKDVEGRKGKRPIFKP